MLVIKEQPLEVFYKFYKFYNAVSSISLEVLKVAHAYKFIKKETPMQLFSFEFLKKF